MSNKKLFLLIALTSAVTLSGCGKKDAETEQPAPSKEEAQTEEVSEPVEELAAITPSDYLVKDASKYVTLASLDGLAAEQSIYEVTDEMVQDRVEEERYMYSEEVDKDKAEEGDTVYADVSYSVQGSDDSESDESTYFIIGDEDYGAEFDAQLLGKSTGDEMSFSVSYDDDTWYEEWSGKTVDFTVKVTGVYQTIVPEYDDDFIAENTEYDSKEEYEESLREMMESEYSQESYTSTVEDLFQSVIDQSEFDGYPEELYTDCENEIISYYGQFLGTTDKDTIMDSLGITAEDLESEVLDSVNLRLVICAICEKENLEITEDEYVSQVTEDAETYGYISPVEYENVNSRESLVWTMYQDKVGEYLYDKADITPVQGSADDLYANDIFEIETEEETVGADEIYAAELETEE